MLRSLGIPRKTASLLLVAMLTPGLVLALRGGILGIPLGVLLVWWFFKYCFLLLDAVMADETEPPVLSLEALNPLNELRPLVQAGLILCGAQLGLAARSIAGPLGLAIVGAPLIAALPASIAVLGLTSSPIQAASPRALFALARGLGRDYLWLTLALLISAVVLYGIARLDAPLSVMLAMAQFTLLFLFALIGGAVLENRHALGIGMLTRAERLAARERQAHEGERGRMLERSYGQLRLSRSLDAWQEIEGWLAAHGGAERADMEYSLLIEATARWHDPRIADRLARDFLTQLLARGDNGRALDVAERRLAANPGFVPAQADGVRLAELAGYAGRRALQQRLAAVTKPVTSTSST
jgi:hypothetical protein